ncbi:MAG: thioredoxin domain-containing protein [Leptospirales bacterium]|nr:thioredoxin domain-containing protein [Leptospirales bacterium]
MKKYITPMLILSVAGVVISSLLLYQHYFPDFEIGFISCRTNFSNPCIAVGQSVYSSIFGIPVASFGILYFMLLTFLILIADYARHKYYKILCGIGFPLVTIGLAADIVLGILMIKIGQLCTLCAASYIVNLAILIVLILLIKNNFSADEIKASLKSFFLPKGSDEKAILSLSVISVFCLAFVVFSITNIMRSKSGVSKIQDINRSISNFYEQKEEEIEFPESNLIIGKSDAEVKVYIFNDFLCSSCRKLYDIEKYIIPKYENKLRIIYYHYPLDKSCNNDMEETIYPSSCLASKSMYAAAEAGFFKEYFYIHFLHYEDYKDRFDIEHIDKNLAYTGSEFKIKPKSIDKFKSIINSKDNIDQILKHIESAKKLNIEATPTIIISGRRLVGVPSKELFESIIEKELGK